MLTTTFNVQGMSCGHCVNSVETAVKNIGAHAKVDLANNTVTVDYDETKVSFNSIKESIEEQGYDVV